MADFDFNGKEVLALIEHAEAASAHYMSATLRYERYGTFDLVPGEELTAPAGLWLVKDQGVYLLSNSHPVRLGPVYARGYGRDADWQLVQEAAGGDDFVEHLPFDESIKNSLRRGADLRVGLTSVQITIGTLEPVIGPAISAGQRGNHGVER